MKVTSISLYMHGCQVVTEQGTLTIRNGRFDNEESRALAVRMANEGGNEVLESLTAVVLNEAEPINYWDEALTCINLALGVRFDDTEQVFVPVEAPSIPTETI
jgi:hypothetical protein